MKVPQRIFHFCIENKYLQLEKLFKFSTEIIYVGFQDKEKKK